MRVGGIDVGSYSVRLTIAEGDNGSIKIIKERGEITSLAEGLKERGRLRKDRIEETLRVLEGYRREVEELGCERVRVVGTEALRRAQNADEFIELVRKRTGFEIEIISPEEEGKLAFLAVAYSLKPPGEFLVIDQGGGSTEFVFGAGMEPEEVISIPMGIVSLTEMFIKNDPPKAGELEDLRDYVKEKVKPLVRKVSRIVGLGGTITTLVALERDVYPYDPSKVHGTFLEREALSKWLTALSSVPSSRRPMLYPQVERKRARVIIAGIAMYEVIMELFGEVSLQVSDWGVKHGLIILTLRDEK